MIAQSSDHPEIPEDQDSDTSSHLEVPVAGGRDDENTQKTPYYFMTIDIEV